MSDELTEVLGRLTKAVEDAGPRLRTRKEFRAARDWLRAQPESEDAADDQAREASAHLDMLALLQAEIDEKVAGEEKEKGRRKREDEALLQRLQSEFKLYAALIVAGFLIPPFLLAPFPQLCAVGIVPPLVGFLRVRGIHKQLEGRQWIILLDTVEEHTGRLKFADYTALAALGIGLLWTVVGFIRAGMS